MKLITKLNALFVICLKVKNETLPMFHSILNHKTDIVNTVLFPVNF